MARQLLASLLAIALSVSTLSAAEWTGWRGPNGDARVTSGSLPTAWATGKNVAWKTPTPGPGTSCPLVVGERVYVTCYTGYGLEPGQGDPKQLNRHLLCLDRKTGEELWTKRFEPKLPEHRYSGEGSYHGYAASTPATDGKSLFLFLGKSGVYCLDLDGKQVWHADVGGRTNGWGSGTSPVLYQGLVIVNASVESGSMVALDQKTGRQVWKTGGMSSSWNTPVITKSTAGGSELVVSISGRVLGLDPLSGEKLWNADGVHRYVCPSVVAHKGVAYIIGGGHTSLAVKVGGRGDVTKSHGVWRLNKGSNVSSPIYHEGHLYWAHDSNGSVFCQDAATGKIVYQKRLEPRPGRIWSSPILGDGKLYYTSQHNGTFVIAAGPKFQMLAHNVFADDKTRTNASPVPSRGQLLFRSDQAVYLLGTEAD
jgi:outer membrane protein assembly factor BamB